MALAVAAISVALITLRPFGIRSWIWPLAGALIVVLFGFEPASIAGHAIERQWNVLLFIGGLMGLGAVASEAGVFRSVAGKLLGYGRGERRRLFVWTFLGGAAMTALLSNDATAVILTPIIYDAVSELGIDPMPYVLAGLFVADTASFGLPFSNPANVVILPHPSIWPYLLHLGVPELAAIAINLGIFLWVFRRQLNGAYAVPVAPVEHPKALRVGIGLMLVTVAYVVALITHFPLGPVAAIAALLLLALAGVSPVRVVRRMGWTTLAMLCGLFVLLDAVVRSNAANGAIHVLDQHPFDLAVAASSAGAAALLSNLFNNLPVAIAGAYAVVHDPTGHVAYPLIAGVDLGPNLTFGGSIATLLCLDVLRRHGVRVSLLQYAKLGLAVVPACLAVTVLWLWILH
ncbi:MAG: SLC13 family permease [Candidatus Tumulicola sp.]